MKRLFSKFLNPFYWVKLVKTRIAQKRDSISGETETLDTVFKESYLSVKKTMQKAGKGEDFYKMPWLMFTSENSASQTPYLRQAIEQSPHVSPESQELRGWRWWFAQRWAAIETDPMLVSMENDGATIANLMAVIEEDEDRKGAAINGLVHVLDASLFLEDHSSIQDLAAKYRSAIDQAVKRSGKDIPVHFLVCGLDKLRGWNAFVSAIPDSFLNRALGVRCPEQYKSERKIELLEVEFNNLKEKLDEITIGLLFQTLDRDQKAELFYFLKTLVRVFGGFISFSKLFLDEGKLRSVPNLRSLYFVSSGKSEPGFRSDVLRELLPQDGRLVA